MAFYSGASERRAAESARKQARRRAAVLNVTIEERLDGSWHELLLQAPAGSSFAMAGVHEIVIANAGPTTDGLWQAAKEALDEDQIVKCDNECEWCHEA